MQHSLSLIWMQTPSKVILCTAGMQLDTLKSHIFYVPETEFVFPPLCYSVTRSVAKKFNLGHSF